MAPDTAATTYRTLVVEKDDRGRWAWTCVGCWLGFGLDSEASAREEAATHVANGHGDPTVWEQPA